MQSGNSSDVINSNTVIKLHDIIIITYLHNYLLIYLLTYLLT